MKNANRILYMLLCMVTVLGMLAGCDGTELPSEPTVPEQPTLSSENDSTPPETTIPQTEVSTTVPVTEPEHSALYIPGVCVEDVIIYFNDVCLDSEFINSVNPSYVQKW
ncbi:MAG: hypothetical protein IJX37_10000, partial [Oscillospiraceae bacterium]|nr:hypothetical protein [Oscillospiraceae bacterium]